MDKINRDMVFSVSQQIGNEIMIGSIDVYMIEAIYPYNYKLVKRKYQSYKI